MMRSCLMALLLLPILGCGPDAPQVSSEDGAAVAEIARPAAAELLRTLVGRLNMALDEGGPMAALEVCSDQAMPLTQEVQDRLNSSLDLKRTSFRYRNPANAPDEGEEAALLFFERAVQGGSGPPPHMVQRFSDQEFRYYQPLFVGEMCLGCHGDPGSMDPDVVEALSNLYPEDLATGYKAGDFRGVVRVSVPASTMGEGEP